MADRYDEIYGYGSDIAAVLRENDAVNAAYAAHPTVVTKSIEPTEPSRQQQQQQQQPEPNIADLHPAVQKRWDDWFSTNFFQHWRAMKPKIEKKLSKSFHNINENFRGVEKEFDGVYGEIDEVAGQHDKKIYQLLEIVQVLSVDNAFLSGRIDQIQREFKGLTRTQAVTPARKQAKTIERTIATTTEEERRVSKTLSIIDEVLHG
jgi:hypothetical protein